MHMEPKAQDSSTSNDPLATVDPYLPPELERLIFELVARDIGPEGSTTLLLVAKRVYEWWVLYFFDIIIEKRHMSKLEICRIRPLIYRVFNQIASPPFPDFKKFPQLLESTGHLAERLIVAYDPTQYYLAIETLLSFCPNIVDLALRVFRTTPIFPILDKLPLRRLSANFDDLTYEDFLARPFFVNLTHLEIPTFIGATWDQNFEALVHLPNLTHLSIGFWTGVDDDVIPQLLRHCRLLRILIVAPLSPRHYLERKGIKKLLSELDHHLVFVEIPPFPALVRDWVKGALGGIDYWAFSELISLAQSRVSFFSFMICDNLLIPLLEYTGNYFVDPPPQYFPIVGFDWEKHLNGKGFEWFTELHLHDPGHK